jgi:hypothetical protein
MQSLTRNLLHNFYTIRLLMSLNFEPHNKNRELWKVLKLLNHQALS